MKAITLIDADSLAYIGGKCEEVEQAYDKVDEAISNIITTSGASHYNIFVEKPFNNNFRKKIVKSYKKSRANKELPKYYNEIKEYLIGTWNAVGLGGYESDDVLISYYRKCKEEYPFTEVMIASMDKDLRQYSVKIFDTYYNRFGEVYDITEDEADYNFWLQMIMGDVVDSISGVRGKGIKKAETVLNGAKNRFIAVCRTYREVYGSRWQKEFIKNLVQVRLLDNLNVQINLDEVNYE